MHISFAVFADAANLSQEGKLNILGVFDAVQVGGLRRYPRRTSSRLKQRLESVPQVTFRQRCPVREELCLPAR